MKQLPNPDARLRSAVPYLTRGGTVADIGTDHAILPVYLVREGISRRAVASDINQGPLETARANIRAAGLTDRIDTLLTDGLHGIEPYRPDDVLVFGMGGELIAKILSEAPWIKNQSVGLILQPMSRAHVLRGWLAENGFTVLGECLTDETRLYQTVYARWSGEVTVYSEAELLLGRENIRNRPPLFDRFIAHEIAVTGAVVAGKKKSGNADSEKEENLLASLLKIQNGGGSER